MARLFCDTCALIKLYRDESDSESVRSCVAEVDTIYIARITPLEYRSAFAILVRQRKMSAEDAHAYVTAFIGSMADYENVDVGSAILARAEELLEAHAETRGLRTLDAIQLASALTLHAVEPIDALLTTDRSLRAAAMAEGLKVLP